MTHVALYVLFATTTAEAMSGGASAPLAGGLAFVLAGVLVSLAFSSEQPMGAANLRRGA